MERTCVLRAWVVAYYWVSRSRKANPDPPPPHRILGTLPGPLAPSLPPRFTTQDSRTGSLLSLSLSLSLYSLSLSYSLFLYLYLSISLSLSSHLFFPSFSLFGRKRVCASTRFIATATRPAVSLLSANNNVRDNFFHSLGLPHSQTVSLDCPFRER